MPINRRRIMQNGVYAVLAGALTGCSGTRDPMLGAADSLAELERTAGGRLGVGIIDAQSGQCFGHRLDERFALCSTFKLPLAALILWQAQQGKLQLDASVALSEDDLVPHAPVTERYLEKGFMSVIQLAEATQTTSDNVAANLLLGLIGGPAGFTELLRAIGDEVTRLDRYEPELNFVPADEIRDTTTPRAAATTTQRLVDGSVLSSANGRLLRGWLEATSTGLQRLRAGFPSEWPAGDKTGTAYAAGMNNKYNDVAVAWPDGSSPGLIVSAFYEADGEYDRMRPEDILILRRAGEIASRAFLSLNS